MDDKKAVVLGGGGARGAYQIGVWRYLEEIGYDYKLITGASVGALNGAAMAMHDIKLGMDMWSQISTQMIIDYTPQGDISSAEKQREAALELIEKAIKEKGIDQTPLRKLLEQTLDAKAVRSSDAELGIVTAKYPSLKGVEVFANEIPEEKLIDYLMASSACFPAMRAVEIDGEQYIDGGFYDVLPIRLALERGATEIVAVNLKSPGLHPKPIKKNMKNIKITVVEPKSDLGFLLLFEPNLAKTNIERGYLDAKKAFGAAEGFNYTFKGAELSSYKRKMRALLMRILGNERNATAAEKLFAQAQFQVISLKLAQRTSAEEVRTGIAVACAETAGAVLGINPLREYSLAEFNREVLHALSEIEEPELFKNPDIAAALKTITDEKYVTKFLVSELKRCFREKQSTSHIVSAAVGLYPSALIAAFYCIFALLVGKQL